MPTPRKTEKKILKALGVLHVATSLTASFRATLDFFAEKDVAMKKYHPTPFRNWLRGDRHFNLVSSETRRVIRFEPNRFIVRVEGYPTLDPFDETLDIAKELLAAFRVSDLFGMAFTSVRSQAAGSLEEARARFANSFLTERSTRLLKLDALTDFAVVAERNWPASPDFERAKKPSLAPLQIRESVKVGPVSYEEIGQKWTEFKKDAQNKLYVTDHAAPRFAILADTKFEGDRRKGTESLKMDLLWRFYDWARDMADKTWAQVEV
jgi:hypothetical protein